MLSKVGKGDYDLAAVSTPGISDPSEVVSDYLSTNPKSDTGYSNPKVDDLIVKGIGTTDIENVKQFIKNCIKS